jgi:hypothetical protein
MGQRRLLSGAIRPGAYPHLVARTRSGVRFAAGSPTGTRASLWRLWTNPKGDVYLASRLLARRLKVSLHVGGRYRMAFTDQHPADPTMDRAFVKWERKDNIAAGLTRALSLPVVAADATIPCRADSRQLEIVWKPPPPAGQLGSVTVLLGLFKHAAASGASWPGQRSMGTELVYREALGTSETLWVLWHTEPLTAAHIEARESLRQRAAAHRDRLGELLPNVDLADPALRVVGMNEEDGCGVLWDVPVSFETAGYAPDSS